MHFLHFSYRFFVLSFFSIFYPLSDLHLQQALLSKRWTGIRANSHPLFSLGLRVHSNLSPAVLIFHPVIIIPHEYLQSHYILSIYPIATPNHALFTSCHHLSSMSITHCIVFFSPRATLAKKIKFSLFLSN